MKLEFVKMHGLGNDFVLIDQREQLFELDQEAVAWMGDRHRGIGFDQLAQILPSKTADAEIRFYNQDGSEAGACGNATRCIGQYLYERDGKKDQLLDTLGGRLKVTVLGENNVKVEMAVPEFNWAEIPLAKECDTLFVPLETDGLPPPVALSMGNPHIVFFVDDVDLVEKHGPEFERHPMFPQGANIGFARVKKEQGYIRLRVFERGAGLTLACGSGACAALVAAVKRELLDGAAPAVVELDGGELTISWAGNGTPVMMTGLVATSFQGFCTI